jgi:hypothetical protein
LKLKIDFHTHTGEDPQEHVKYFARQLIDKAAQEGYDALAITNHNLITFSRNLESYAGGKGILLIPGVEVTASNCHVLVINPQFKPNPKGCSLAELLALKNEESLFIAPHPFFHFFKSLRSRLYPILPYFDAIEYSIYQNSYLNLNKKAERTAKFYGKPMVGTSDCHNIWQFGKTWTFVEGEKNIPSIVSAVKDGKTKVRSTPISLVMMARVLFNLITVEKLLRFFDRH